jgi:uncharacterized membrane protein YbhN (UPF0104 family)
MLILLIAFGVRDELLQQAGWAAGIFYMLALVMIVIFMVRRSWIEGLITRFLPDGLAHKFLDLTQGFASGLESLRNGKQLAMVSLLSVLTWAMIPLSFYPVLIAFDFGQPVPFFGAVLAVPMLAFGMMIPAAPGGVGLFEWFGGQALLISFQANGTPLTLQYEAVVAASIVLLHLTQSVPSALLGIWAFIKEGMTTGDLQAGTEL